MSFLSNVTLLGASAAVTTGYSTIWGLGTTAYVQLTAGVAMEVVSNSANDTAAGTGARTVKVSGVTGDYVPFVETITLNGATPVPLVNTSAIAINSMEVMTAGSGGTNAGRIDGRTVSGSAIKSTIRASDVPGMSHDFIFTVPAGRYAKLKRVAAYIAGPTAGFMSVVIRSYTAAGAYKTNGVMSASFDLAGFNGTLFMDYSDGIYFPEKTLIMAMGAMSAGSATLTSALGELELYSM